MRICRRDHEGMYRREQEAAEAAVDARLAARARCGDRGSFDTLVRRYHDLVVRFFERRLGSRDAAQEATQETFARAFVRVETLRCAERVRSWLFAFARNVLLETLRARRVEKLEATRVQEAEGGAGGAAAPATPEARLMRRELERAIAGALAGLPQARRTALLLRVGDDADYGDIARRLGWPRSKVKNEIHRARLELRRLLCPW